MGSCFLILNFLCVVTIDNYIIAFICVGVEEDDGDLHEASAVHLDDSHVSIEFKCLQGPDDQGVEGQTTITIIGADSEHLQQDINSKILSQWPDS